MNAWYDRFFGKQVLELPGQVFSGRFIAKDDCVLNGHTTLKSGDCLLNDSSGRFDIDSNYGLFVQNKKFKLKKELEIIESAILAYQEAIDANCSSSFLIPEKLLGHFKLTKLEWLLSNILQKGHLQEITRRPKMELIYDENLVPLSRARKIAASANYHLASHSECWQSRTLTGVIPKQILALESEDQLNIYENRVYVKLLEEIERSLVKRVEEVKDLEEIFKKARKFNDAQGIYFELKNSIYTLFGEGFSDEIQVDNAVEEGSATLDVLTKMLKKIRTLQHSDLYLALRHKVHVPDKLNMTNVLLHDQHYRHVARLWNVWQEMKKASELEPEQIYQRNVKLTNAYTRFCTDLVKRTLIEIGFHESSSNYFNRIGSQSVHLKLSETSEIFLVSDKQSLCFIPTFNNIQSHLDITFKDGEQRILLSLHRKSNSEKGALCSSPTYFYSLEQLALFISKWLARQVYENLGQTVFKTPVSFVEFLKGINTSNYWKIEINNLTVIRPCLVVKPKLLEFKNRNRTDISICNAVDALVNTIETFECFLHCPCCGTKADDNQWIIRDDNCFSIRNSNCNHVWEVSRQTNGNKVLNVSPNKSSEQGWVVELESSGRYMFLVNL